MNTDIVYLKLDGTLDVLQFPRKYVEYFTALEPFLTAIEEGSSGPHTLEINRCEAKTIRFIESFIAYLEADREDQTEDFLNGLNDDSIVAVFLMSDYLDFGILQKKCAASISNRLRGASPDRITRLTGFINDYTPEKQREIKKKTQWGECVFPEAWKSLK
jgi:hypothetical protein